MMVWLPAQYSHRTVYLLHKKRPHHFVAECHGRKPQQAIGATSHIVAEPIRTAYHKYKVARKTRHFSVYETCKIARRHLLSVLIKKHHEVSRLDHLEHLHPFGLILRRFGSRFCSADIGQLHYFKRHIALHSGSVSFGEFAKRRVAGASRDHQLYFHARIEKYFVLLHKSSNNNQIKHEKYR